jgi:hypothetical protein
MRGAARSRLRSPPGGLSVRPPVMAASAPPARAHAACMRALHMAAQRQCVGTMTAKWDSWENSVSEGSDFECKHREARKCLSVGVFGLIAFRPFLAFPLACVCGLWRLLELRTYPAQVKKRTGECEFKTLLVKTVKLQGIVYYNLGKAAEAWQLLGITKRGVLVNARCARTHAHECRCYGC